MFILGDLNASLGTSLLKRGLEQESLSLTWTPGPWLLAPLAAAPGGRALAGPARSGAAHPALHPRPRPRDAALEVLQSHRVRASEDSSTTGVPHLVGVAGPGSGCPGLELFVSKVRCVSKMC